MAVFDRVQVATATTGTGTITLGAGVRHATEGDWISFAEAGIPNATAVSYFIIDGHKFAFGVGTYTASGTTLSRDAAEKSWNGSALATAPLALSGTAQVFISPRAADLPLLNALNIFSQSQLIATTGLGSGAGLEVRSNDNNAPNLVVAGNNAAATPSRLYFRLAGGSSEIIQIGGATTGTGRLMIGSDVVNPAANAYFDMKTDHVELVQGYLHSSGKIGVGGASFAPSQHVHVKAAAAQLFLESPGWDGDTAVRLKDANAEWAAGIDIGATGNGYYTIYDLSAGPAFHIVPATRVASFYGRLELQAGVTGNVVPAAAPADNAIGYLGSPQIATTTTYTLVMADAGKHFYHTSASVHTLTIPANASVAFPIGTVIGIVNENGAGALNIAITSDTLRYGSSTGSRQLSANATATLLKVAATVWRLSGDGIV